MKRVSLLLMCLFFTIFFTSCGKDKVVEKIIYGEPITDGDNGDNGNNGYIGNEQILDKQHFNSITISMEFNSADDFYNYMKSHYMQDLRGVKIKIKGPFTVSQYARYNNNEYYSRLHIDITRYNTTPYLSLYIDFIDTSTTGTTSVSSVENVIFIVRSNISGGGGTSGIVVNGYSYL